jgi:hypothetical protein
MLRGQEWRERGHKDLPHDGRYSGDRVAPRARLRLQMFVIAFSAMKNLLAGGILYIACAVSMAQALDQDIESLKGLPPVDVSVRVEAPISVGIGEADLKAAVELRLRNSGFKIATGWETINAPKLFVSVMAPSEPVVGKLAFFGIRVSLAQFVRPLRADESTAPTLLLITWKRDNRAGMVSNGSVVEISTRNLVETSIDEFASDFRLANPK